MRLEKNYRNKNPLLAGRAAGRPPPSLPGGVRPNERLIAINALPGGAARSWERLHAWLPLQKVGAGAGGTAAPGRAASARAGGRVPPPAPAAPPPAAQPRPPPPAPLYRAQMTGRGAAGHVRAAATPIRCPDAGSPPDWAAPAHRRVRPPPPPAGRGPGRGAACLGAGVGGAGGARGGLRGRHRPHHTPAPPRGAGRAAPLPRGPERRRGIYFISASHNGSKNPDVNPRSGPAAPLPRADGAGATRRPVRAAPHGAGPQRRPGRGPVPSGSAPITRTRLGPSSGTRGHCAACPRLCSAALLSACTSLPFI